MAPGGALHPLLVAFQKLLIWGCMGLNGALYPHPPLLPPSLLCVRLTDQPLCCASFPRTAYHFLSPGSVDEYCGGKVPGAIVRATTFLIVFWIFLFERWRNSADHDAHTAKINAEAEAKAAKQAEAAGKGSAVAEKGGAKKRKKAAVEPTVEMID